VSGGLGLVACLRGARAAWRGQPWFLDGPLHFGGMGPRSRRVAVLMSTPFFAGLSLLGVAVALAGIVDEHPAPDWIMMIVNVAVGLMAMIFPGLLVGNFVEFTNRPRFLIPPGLRNHLRRQP
jgi:hypothetical protein